MNKSKYILFSALFIGFIAVSSANVPDWVGESAWNDRPEYAQDMNIQVNYRDVIEKAESRQVCDSYSNNTLENGTTVQTCDNYVTEYYGGENTYIFDLINKQSYYLGNGSVYLQFEIERNQLTKELFKSQKNPRQKSKFIDYFNNNFLFRDKFIDLSSYDTFLGFAEDVNVNSIGDSVKGKNLESKNLIAVSNSRVETVISLQDFKNGGVVINDALEVEVIS